MCSPVLYYHCCTVRVTLCGFCELCGVELLISTEVHIANLLNTPYTSALLRPSLFSTHFTQHNFSKSPSLRNIID